MERKNGPMIHYVILSVGNNALEKHSISSFNMHPQDGGKVFLEPFICSNNPVRFHKPEDHLMNTDSAFRSFFEGKGNVILLPS